MLVADPSMPFITQRVVGAKERLEHAESDVNPPDFAEEISVTALQRVTHTPANQPQSVAVNPAA